MPGVKSLPAGWLANEKRDLSDDLRIARFQDVDPALADGGGYSRELVSVGTCRDSRDSSALIAPQGRARD